MINVYENSKIYIACPPYAQTGGPEALHVLAYELRNLGFDAYMFYGGSYANPVAKAYQKYDVPYVPDVEATPQNAIIVPEIWGHKLNQYPNMQKGFYWLSVDNYFGTTEIDFNDNTITHLTQSYYALDFVQKQGAKNISYLSDYLNEFYIKNAPKEFVNREDIILYNPAKGIQHTNKIIQQAPNLDFVAISGMNQEQIKDLCLKSKIYIDFGQHPGKDRIPRETAILGNIVITNKAGSANFYEDVPIGHEYKFDNVSAEITQIINKLEYCLKNYEICIKDFENYRHTIKHEKEKFISDIQKIFIRN